MRAKRLVSGHVISPYEANHVAGDPPMVTMHKLGTDERSYLTPTEALELADALTAAAKEAIKR